MNHHSVFFIPRYKFTCNNGMFTTQEELGMQRTSSQNGTQLNLGWMQVTGCGKAGDGPLMSELLVGGCLGWATTVSTGLVHIPL